MSNVDQLYYVGTEKGRQIDKLQANIHDQLVSDCSIFDIGQVIGFLPNDRAMDLQKCFHDGRSSEFYQLILNMMYDYYKQQAIDSALRIGEYEY
jgi:hypothetical protein